MYYIFLLILCLMTSLSGYLFFFVPDEKMTGDVDRSVFLIAFAVCTICTLMILLLKYQSELKKWWQKIPKGSNIVVRILWAIAGMTFVVVGLMNMLSWHRIGKEYSIFLMGMGVIIIILFPVLKLEDEEKTIPKKEDKKTTPS